MDVCPEGQTTLRAVGLRPVSRQTTMRKSAPFRVGAIVASPIRAITARRSHFFRNPLPTTDARQFTPPLVAPCGATPLWAYPVPCGEHGPGGPRLSAGDRHVSVPPPSREATGHVPFWFEPVSRFGSFKLDGIYQWFTYVGPLTQPGASSRFRLPESHDDPRGHRVPIEGGYVVSALGTRSLPTPHCT